MSCQALRSRTGDPIEPSSEGVWLVCLAQVPPHSWWRCVFSVLQHPKVKIKCLSTRSILLFPQRSCLAFCDFRPTISPLLLFYVSISNLPPSKSPALCDIIPKRSQEITSPTPHLNTVSNLHHLNHVTHKQRKSPSEIRRTWCRGYRRRTQRVEIQRTV